MPIAPRPEIADKMGIHADDKRLYTTIEPMRHLLAELGVRGADSVSPFERWGQLPNRCLLATKWHIEAELPHWHWVVFWRDGSESVILGPGRISHIESQERLPSNQPQVVP